MIACELQLLHPKPESRVNFDLEVFWYGAGDNLIHRNTFHTFVPAGSASSWHATAWGCPEHPCPKRLKGAYHVVFAEGDTKVATGSFEIY